VAEGVKLPPQLEQQIGHLRQHRLSAMDPGMAGRGRPNNAVTRRNLSPLFFCLKATEISWADFVANVSRFETVCWSADMGQTRVADVYVKNNS